MLQATDENLDWALSLEADRMVNSFVARKDLDTEMTVVRNEYERGENSPHQRADQAPAEHRLRLAQLRQLHHRQPLRHRERRHRAPAGLLSSTYYQPDNAVLTVAGKFDPAKALQLVAKHFNAHPEAHARAAEAVDGGTHAGWRADRGGAPRG